MKVLSALLMTLTIFVLVTLAEAVVTLFDARPPLEAALAHMS
jgi:hypothetical protein